MRHLAGDVVVTTVGATITQAGVAASAVIRPFCCSDAILCPYAVTAGHFIPAFEVLKGQVHYFLNQS